MVKDTILDFRKKILRDIIEKYNALHQEDEYKINLESRAGNQEDPTFKEFRQALRNRGTKAKTVEKKQVFVKEIIENIDNEDELSENIKSEIELTINPKEVKDKIITLMRTFDISLHQSNKVQLKEVIKNDFIDTDRGSRLNENDIIILTELVNEIVDNEFENFSKLNFDIILKHVTPFMTEYFKNYSKPVVRNMSDSQKKSLIKFFLIVLEKKVIAVDLYLSSLYKRNEKLIQAQIVKIVRDNYFK